MPSPTATPPVAPKAERSAAGAEAFVGYFWEVHNYTYKTLDLSRFRQLGEKNCSFCASTIKDLEGIISRNNRVEGSAVKLHAAAVPPGKIGTRVLVSTVISQDSGREISTNGTIKSFNALPKTQSSIALLWKSNHWLVHDVSIEKKKSTK
jgi:Family of unknown function (DUF6318)